MSKSPKLNALKAQLEAEKEAILAIVAPHRAYFEAHRNDPKFIEARRVIKEANPRLAEIDNELAGLARAVGSRGIKVDAGVYE